MLRHVLFKKFSLNGSAQDFCNSIADALELSQYQNISPIERYKNCYNFFGQRRLQFFWL